MIRSLLAALILGFSALLSGAAFADGFSGGGGLTPGSNFPADILGPPVALSGNQTLSQAQCDQNLTFNAAATVTLPSTIAAGCHIAVHPIFPQTASAVVQFVAGSGATLDGANSCNATKDEFFPVGLYTTATGVWELFGDCQAFSQTPPSWARAGSFGPATTSGTICSITGVTIPAGDIVLISAGYPGNNGNQDATAASDGGSNTYSLGPNSTSANGSATILYNLGLTTALSSATITVTFNASSANPSICFLEYFTPTGSAVDPNATGAAATGASSAINPGSLTTTHANDLVYAFAFSTSASSDATGWTANGAGSVGSISFSDAWQSQAAAGASGDPYVSTTQTSWASAVIGIYAP